jgi:hypothetical protein
MKNCRTVVFWQWREGKKLLTMVFQQQKRKERAKQLMDGVVSSMEKCEELSNCSVLAMGRRRKVVDNGVSTTEKKGRNNCWMVLFCQWGNVKNC